MPQVPVIEELVFPDVLGRGRRHLEDAPGRPAADLPQIRAEGGLLSGGPEQEVDRRAGGELRPDRRADVKYGAPEVRSVKGHCRTVFRFR